ncbi:MAG TPA: histidine kinase [Polyangiaceae bacterium]|jgi:signal transduction histidine kinase
MAASSVARLARSTVEAPPERSEAPPSAATRSPSRTIGVLVVAGVMLLQFAADVVAGRETARILARMCFMACELPLLMVALSTVFGWSLRRRMTAGQGILAGVGIATAFGSVFGLTYGAVAGFLPELRLHMPPSSGALLLTRFALYGVLNAQMYFGLWAIAVVYPFAIEGARVRDLEAQKLGTEAELTRLRAHLEPHFLLNTLNAIAGLVTEDPREARRLLVSLGELLRDAVEQQEDMQPFAQQIAWLRRYAQILEARHHGSLRFRWEVTRESEEAMTPRLLLQPLVENAVKHGALRRDDGAGEVTVGASLDVTGALVCVVEDNGPGMPDSEVRAGAFGLQAVRRRLTLEAPSASLKLESSDGGTRATIRIPRESGVDR